MISGDGEEAIMPSLEVVAAHDQADDRHRDHLPPRRHPGPSRDPLPEGLDTSPGHATRMGQRGGRDSIPASSMYACKQTCESPQSPHNPCGPFSPPLLTGCLNLAIL
jgi:hypothetical protein